jgi:hypothetical protein
MVAHLYEDVPVLKKLRVKGVKFNPKNGHHHAPKSDCEHRFKQSWSVPCPAIHVSCKQQKLLCACHVSFILVYIAGYWCYRQELAVNLVFHWLGHWICCEVLLSDWFVVQQVSIAWPQQLHLKGLWK